MPSEPDPTRERALTSLDERLSALEAQRAPKASPIGETRGLNEGYRLLAGLIGGVLGGLGLGWTFDRFAHTSPFGLVSGLLIGTVGSVVGAVVSAQRMSARAAAQTGSVPTAGVGEGPADEDDE